MSDTLVSLTKAAPIPFDRGRAAEVLATFGEPLDPALVRLVEGIAGCSPYLARSLTVEAEYLLEQQLRDPADCTA